MVYAHASIYWRKLGSCMPNWPLSTRSSWPPIPASRKVCGRRMQHCKPAHGIWSGWHETGQIVFSGDFQSRIMPEFTFSFIIPTRGRPASLPRLCDSIRTHTSHPDRLEIVFVMDSDDLASLMFEYSGLNIRKVEVAPGMAMGELNMAGYRAASGRYLMLLNDDVVLRTPAWDERVLEVFRSYPDGIVLVHVNENIFREKLCTFPFLTRNFCELADGICPSGYLRYRIHDHIHNVFDLITLLGHRRRIFLPDVIFEHHNFVKTDQGHDYVPNPEIHAIDTRLFDALLPERKRLALVAMATIDRHARSE